MGGEYLDRLGDAVLRNAKRMYLQTHPLITEDHIGQYAYLLHQTAPSPACCLYYLDSKRRLLTWEVLYSGITLSAEECCMHLIRRMKELEAAGAAVSIARSPAGTDRDELDRASRIALFCEAENVPLADVVWVDAEGYLPLCRYFGRENHNE